VPQLQQQEGWTVTSPGRYRKKPIEVEAIQFTGGAAAATPIIDWMLANDCAATWHEAHDSGHVEGWDPYPARPEGITIETREGDMLAEVGDWVIREPFPTTDRLFYPCKPDIFAATYDQVRPDGEGPSPEVQRLRAGEDTTPIDEGTWPTPGQWIARWNAMTADERLSTADALITLCQAEAARVERGHLPGDEAVRLSRMPGTKVQCPCGEWVELTLTIGEATRTNGREVVLPISFDRERFVEAFTVHVLADPERPGHDKFVTRRT
jgi:hypothetical protein